GATLAPLFYTFLPSDKGVHTLSAVLSTSGTQNVTAMDLANNMVGVSGPIAVRGLVVTSLTATPTGFTATFSKPFVNSSTSPLNLYDAASGNYGAADVSLMGSSGLVRGSLIIDPNNTSFTFIKTDVAGGGTGDLLAAGSYTVTIVSGVTA